MATQSISERTREQALKALDGMAQIVKNEMLIRGQYIDDSIDEEKSTAICRGHRYCAIGSLWVAGGVRPEKHVYQSASQSYVTFTLPGVGEESRKEFLRNRHGLRAAYDALNAAAMRYAKRHRIEEYLHEGGFEAPIEGLFESSALDAEESAVDRKKLLGIIGSAKRSLKAAA